MTGKILTTAGRRELGFIANDELAARTPKGRADYYGHKCPVCLEWTGRVHRCSNCERWACGERCNIYGEGGKCPDCVDLARTRKQFNIVVRQSTQKKNRRSAQHFGPKAGGRRAGKNK